VKLEGEGVRPMGIAVSPDGARVYVTTGRGGTLVVIDAATLQPSGQVTVGARPWGLGLLPDGSRIYTANGPSNDVTVVDTAALRVETKIPAGSSPWGIAVAGCGATAPRESSVD
jgi:YVTN family beta-propeller protein